MNSSREVDEIDLEDMFVDFPALSAEESRELEGPITYDEVLTVLKSMQNYKSPGPGGFTVEF